MKLHHHVSLFCGAAATAVMANAVPRPTPAPTAAPEIMEFETFNPFPYALEKRSELEKRQTCGVMCNSTSCCGYNQECFLSFGEYRCRIAGLGDLSSAMSDLSSLLTGTDFDFLTSTSATGTNRAAAASATSYDFNDLMSSYYNIDYSSIYSSIMAEYSQDPSLSSLLAAAATATDLSYLDNLLNGGSTATSGSSSGSTNTDTATIDSEKKKTNVGAIVGGVVGGIGGLALIIGLVCFIMYRKRKAKRAAVGLTNPPPPPATAPAPAAPVTQQEQYAAQYASVLPEKQNVPTATAAAIPSPGIAPPPSVSPMSATGYYQPPPGSPPPQQGQMNPNATQYPQPGAQYFANPPPPPPVPAPMPGASELPQEGVPLQQQQQYVQQQQQQQQGVNPQYTGQSVSTGGVQTHWTGSTSAGGQAPSEVHGESMHQHPGQQNGQGQMYYEMDAGNMSHGRR